MIHCARYRNGIKMTVGSLAAGSGFLGILFEFREASQDLYGCNICDQISKATSKAEGVRSVRCLLDVDDEGPGLTSVRAFGKVVFAAPELDVPSPAP